MRRKTVGAQAVKARSDTTKYDPLEVAHALTNDIITQLEICGERHAPIFDEEEYCLVLIVASDPLIAGVRRHKYAALLYLPKPRPQQSVFLYNKKTRVIKRLWSMPDAKVMATISEMSYVDPKWQKTKAWCDAFFRGDFHPFIRHQYGISMLSEKEYLELNREKLIQSGGQPVDPGFTEAFDFSKITTNQVIESNIPFSN